MVINQTINATTANFNNLINYIGDVGLWIQGVGLFIIIWLCFQIITLIWNWKKKRTLSYIKKDIGSLQKKVNNINKKLDKILKNKK